MAIKFCGQCDPALWEWSVRSHASPAEWYAVRIDLGSGECWCECMDAQCRRRGADVLGGCKHVREVLSWARLHERRRQAVKG